MSYEVHDHRRSFLVKEDYIPLGQGRPDRGVINDDDILNLKIALNTCNDVADFIRIS